MGACRHIRTDTPPCGPVPATVRRRAATQALETVAGPPPLPLKPATDDSSFTQLLAHFLQQDSSFPRRRLPPATNPSTLCYGGSWSSRTPLGPRTRFTIRTILFRSRIRVAHYPTLQLIATLQPASETPENPTVIAFSFTQLVTPLVASIKLPFHFSA